MHWCEISMMLENSNASFDCRELYIASPQDISSPFSDYVKFTGYKLARYVCLVLGEIKLKIIKILFAGEKKEKKEKKE